MICDVHDIGSDAGTLAKPCVHITRSSNFQTNPPDGAISDYPKAPGPLNSSWYHCLEVEWPAPHVWVTRETRNRSLNGPLAWMGTLGRRFCTHGVGGAGSVW